MEQLDQKILQYFYGDISRTDLASYAKSILNKNSSQLIKLLSNWSVNQDEKIFNETRRELFVYYNEKVEEELNPNQAVNQQKNAKNYLISMRFMEGATEDKFKPVLKDILKKYFNDEFSESYIQAICNIMLFEWTNIGLNLKDSILLGIFIDIIDWSIFWYNTIGEHDYIEPQLKEYLEKETGFRVLGQSEYFEKEIKPYLKVKSEANKAGVEVGLNNQQRQAFRNHVIHNHILAISYEQLLERAREFKNMTFEY